jgi:hypothetical protein
VAWLLKRFPHNAEQDYSSGYCPGISPDSLANRFGVKQFYHNEGKDRIRFYSDKRMIKDVGVFLLAF